MEPTGEALDRLGAFVGEWTVHAGFPDAPSGRASFEWALERQFLIQRTSVPVPGAPDSLSIIRPDESTGGYQQHYFDTRGVVRLYAMSFDGREWRLQRDEPDFSPLPFHQRYVGSFTEDGTAIEGRWERSENGQAWELDFRLDYRRAAR
jgi:hypothetical protein